MSVTILLVLVLHLDENSFTSLGSRDTSATRGPSFQHAVVVGGCGDGLRISSASLIDYPFQERFEGEGRLLSISGAS
jgi:hypothetical protein